MSCVCDVLGYKAGELDAQRACAGAHPRQTLAGQVRGHLPQTQTEAERRKKGKEKRRRGEKA